MTKHEVQTLDTVLIGPAMLILNQYFNTFLSEYFVLWLALVSHSPGSGHMCPPPASPLSSSRSSAASSLISAASIPF